MRRGLEEQWLDRATECNCCYQPRHHTGERYRHTLHYDHRHDIVRLRTDCDSHTDLMCALTHCVRAHTIESHSRQEQSQYAEECKHRRTELPRTKLRINQVLQRHNVCRWITWRDRTYCALDFSC